MISGALDNALNIAISIPFPLFTCVFMLLLCILIVIIIIERRGHKQFEILPESKEFKIEQVTCPTCGKEYDMDYPKCPYCKK